MNSQSNLNIRKGNTMKMRARTNDLIILSPDACGYLELEHNGELTLVRGDLGLETVRVIKARDSFTNEWPPYIPSTNLMRVRFEGREYLVSREHRHLCLVGGELRIWRRLRIWKRSDPRNHGSEGV